MNEKGLIIIGAALLSYLVVLLVDYRNKLDPEWKISAAVYLGILGVTVWLVLLAYDA